MIKVFGMIDEVIKAGKVEELKVMDRFEGYSGAPGVAKGLARVITSFEDFPKLQPGDILVCPYTATAWTPPLSQDKGGCYRYGWHVDPRCYYSQGIPNSSCSRNLGATRTIRDGDTIRVDGDEGVVEIIKKVGE